MTRPKGIPNVNGFGAATNGNIWFSCAECDEKIVHVGPTASIADAVARHRERDCQALGTKPTPTRAWTPGDPSRIGPIT